MSHLYIVPRLFVLSAYTVRHHTWSHQALSYRLHRTKGATVSFVGFSRSYWCIVWSAISIIMSSVCPSVCLSTLPGRIGLRISRSQFRLATETGLMVRQYDRLSQQQLSFLFCLWITLVPLLLNALVSAGHCCSQVVRSNLYKDDIRRSECFVDKLIAQFPLIRHQDANFQRATFNPQKSGKGSAPL